MDIKEVYRLSKIKKMENLIILLIIFYNNHLIITKIILMWVYI